MEVDITKLVASHTRFIQRISKLSLTQAKELRDSGKVTDQSEFDSLCAYIGRKMQEVAND